jgi:hypothetical protein
MGNYSILDSDLRKKDNHLWGRDVKTQKQHSKVKDKAGNKKIAIYFLKKDEGQKRDLVKMVNIELSIKPIFTRQGFGVHHFIIMGQQVQYGQAA